MDTTNEAHAPEPGGSGWPPYFCKYGGADRDRTCDPHNAIVVLYQLSYDPIQNARKNVDASGRLSKHFKG